MGNNFKTLREDRGWTLDEAAARFGLSRGGYIKLERNERRLTSDYIEKASEVYGIPQADVISAEPTTRIPIMGYIGAGAEVLPEFEQVPPDGFDQVELPFPTPADMIGLEVRGDSMLPRFNEGDIVVVWSEQRRETKSYVGDDAAVRTTTGRRYLKHIMRGTSAGTYTLVSSNANPIEGVRLAWVGEIFVIVPRSQIRRIEKVAAKRVSPRRQKGSSAAG